MATTLDFVSLGVSEILADKLREQNIVQPTEVQQQAIPILLTGQDVIAQAPTGTGKTFAYVLPVLNRLKLPSKDLQALILAPSRELAMQITRVISELNIADLVTVPLLGGGNVERQQDSLKKKPQIIVGTPGRVLELLKKRKLNAQTIRMVVVDEGDKMCSLGFMEEITAIVRYTLKDRQLMLFSATVNPTMLNTATKMMCNPAMVNITQQGKTADTLQHVFYMAGEKYKTETLRKLVAIYKPQKAIVFINHNEGVTPLTKRLSTLGMAAQGLHSDLSSIERKRVMELFRGETIQLLVTTDLLARGMDIAGVDYVFNYDLPLNEEQYIHRVGRTGRAGRQGTAVTLVTEAQKFVIDKYQKALNIKILQYGIVENKVVPVVIRSKAKKKDQKQSK